MRQERRPMERSSKLTTITGEDWKKSIAMGRNEPNLVRLSIMKSIELLCLAHRYLYYVKCQPVISDYRYDLLESEALKAISFESLLNKPGSDNPKDYPPEAIQLAEKLTA